jgi:hypothetical protein
LIEGIFKEKMSDVTFLKPKTEKSTDLITSKLKKLEKSTD